MIKSAETLLIIEPSLTQLKGHPMNDTIMHYVMYFTTFIYLSYVTIYIIKNIPKQKDPLQGLVFILDVLRYTSMFLSFMLTMYFGTEWGNQLIGSKSLDPLETILAYGFTILLSAWLLLHKHAKCDIDSLSKLKLKPIKA